MNKPYFLNPAHKELAKARYFLKDDSGRTVENGVEDMFKRVVDYLYQNDTEHKDNALKLRYDKKLIDAGRILAQAGTSTKNLFNCFTIGFKDDTREAISELKRKHFAIQAQGGGTGINFSKLRPNGSICKTTKSRSSGAVGFITDFSYQSSNVSQNGNRSGANLGLLEDWHPDLYEFITKKSRSNWENIRKFATVYDEDLFSYFQWHNPYQWQMFNVSVALSDKFMKMVISKSTKPWKLYWNDEEWYLWDFINTSGPKTGSEYSYKITVCAPSEEMAKYKASTKIPFFNNSYTNLVKGPYHLTAYEWFKLICKNAHEDGCPGIIFMDTARKYHNGEYFNQISACNPCSEQALPINSVCNLSSLVLPSFVSEREIQWDSLEEAVKEGVRGLDNVIDHSITGEKDIDEMAKKERRIGLGTTGAAEMLIMLGLKYSSEEGRKCIARVLSFIRDKAYEASVELAKERGSFPAYEFKGFSQSEFFKTLPEHIQNLIRRNGIRNVTILTSAPVGTTGTMLGYSQGCEPYFAMCFMRNSRIGTFKDGSPSFIEWLDDNNIDYSVYGYSLNKLKEKIEVPEYFEEAHDISPEDHLKMQAVFAKYVCSSVSKCVAKGTLINTNKGIIPIESISDARIEDSFSDTNDKYTVIDENGNEKKITKHYYGGLKPCYEIRFSNGFSIIAASTHMFKTENGFKKLSNIKKGEKIFYRTSEIETQKNLIPVTQPHFYNNIKRKFPSHMNIEFAKFIGMWLADGFVSKNSIGIVEKNTIVGNVISQLMYNLFGDEKISYDKRNGVRTHLINSRALSEYFKKRFGTNSLTKRVPKEIMKSAKEIKIAFIEGLSLDGYKKRGNLVIYEGYSKDIAVKTSYILSELGKRYYLGQKHIKNGRLANVSHNVMLVGSLNGFSPIESHKKQLNDLNNDHYQIFVSKSTKDQILKTRINNVDYWKKANIIRSLKKDSFVMLKSLKNYGNIENLGIDQNLSCIKVVDIKFVGNKEVFDIEVKDTHSYLINGVVSHNTINLAKDSKVEDVENAYINAYKMNIKSTTVYRDGSKQQILEHIAPSDDRRPQSVVKAHAPDRPDELLCDIHHTSVRGEKWTVLVGILNSVPYEIFCAPQDSFELADKYKKGKLVKNGKSSYYLDTGDFKIKNISKCLETDEHKVITRLISSCLRHGVPIDSLTDQLSKADGTVVDFSKAMMRVLKKYENVVSQSNKAMVCSNCGSNKVILNSGCPECLECGMSKCG